VQFLLGRAEMAIDYHHPFSFWSGLTQTTRMNYRVSRAALCSDTFLPHTSIGHSDVAADHLELLLTVQGVSASQQLANPVLHLPPDAARRAECRVRQRIAVRVEIALRLHLQTSACQPMSVYGALPPLARWAPRG